MGSPPPWNHTKPWETCWSTLRIKAIPCKLRKPSMRFPVRTALSPISAKRGVYSNQDCLNIYRTETEKVSAKSYTRAQRKSSTSEIHKSAITEHVASSNHVIGWDEAKIIDQEPDKTTRWLKELIWIRSRGNKTINKDEGAYRLDRVYDQIIAKRQPKSLANTSSSQTKKFAAI